MSVRKFIPDAITSMNLLSGAVGVIFTLQGRPDIAFLLMIAAAVFDFFDGFAARMLGAYSDIGKELDSLSDMVSFGLLPSLMLFETLYLSEAPIWIWPFPLFIAVTSALRLAKFNLDERQHTGFLGLPTPACAMICGSLSCYVYSSPGSIAASWAPCWWFIPILSIVLGLLLVSEIPMFSFKFGGKAKADKVVRVKRIVFLVLSAVILAVVLAAGLHWSLIPLGVFVLYILVNLLTVRNLKPEA